MADSGNRRSRTLAQRLSRAVTAVGIAAVLLKVVFPSVRRRAEAAFHNRCRRMIHEMEFGDMPSCEMCYAMHSAMHRRSERETVASQD